MPPRYTPQSPMQRTGSHRRGWASVSTTANVLGQGNEPQTPLTQTPHARGSGAGEGRGRGGCRIRGGIKGARAGANAPLPSHAVHKIQPQERVRVRPTHFLALPLHDHVALQTRISAFQEALFASADRYHPQPSKGSRPQKKKIETIASSLVEGLDSSIVIDPRRLHMTLGVMALEPEPVLEDRADAGGLKTQAINLDIVTTEESIDTTKEESATMAGIDVALGATPASLSDSSPAANPRLNPITSNTDAATDLLAGSIPPSRSPEPSPTFAKKTVSTALALLRSLQPAISLILDGEKGVKVPLDVLDVLKTERIRRRHDVPPASDGAGGGAASGASEGSGEREEREEKVGAGVLFVGPAAASSRGEEDVGKLMRVCDLIHQTFKDAGYVTDIRPLKLHCTVLNASHRKSRFRGPFAYSDILRTGACDLIRADVAEASADKMAKHTSEADSSISNSPNAVEEQATSVQCQLPAEASITASGTQPKYRPPMRRPPPVSVHLGVYDVREVQLWVMGSHGRDNEYVSCGGVVL
ncbi:hypothetical protein B0H34DRAFT_738528 [Crassisporium funariophilum]|nr:hypothetical protein B0H34DRAFT_738528 [Crassisporium funariophilum]